MGKLNDSINIIDDTTAKLIIKMAQTFFSEPKNIKEFNEWHIKEYGYLPTQGITT